MATEQPPTDVQNNVLPEDADGAQLNDVDNRDNDSALGLEAEFLSTTSLASSILNYRRENGRTYNSYGEQTYIIPNDDPELDRLDLQHHMLQLLFDGKLTLCPVAEKKNGHRVLDVGTGSGIWAIDYADEHPESEVIGVDVSPTQPTFAPPNVTFEIDDLEKPWTFHQKFDFIHSRMMTGAFQKWPNFIKQCFDNMSPGGYIELQDIVFPITADDDTLPPSSPFRKHIELMLEASKMMGSPLDSARTYKTLLQDAGFVNVTERWDKMPMNTWPKDKKMKEIGAWTYENLAVSVTGLSVALWTRVLGRSVEELEVALVDVRKEMKDTKIHSYFPLATIIAQKPPVSST